MRQPKLGGKENLRVLLKGGDDLTRSLLSGKEGDGSIRMGLRELVREKYAGTFNVEMVHEPWGLSCMVLQQLELRGVPPEFEAQGLDDFARPQFETRLSHEPFDVLVLSVEQDVAGKVWQHKDSGYLFCPPDDCEASWTPEQKRWLQERFSLPTAAPVEVFSGHMGRLIQMGKERLDLHVIIFNCSTVDPEDRVHNYFGREETMSLRVHKFNLALLELSILQGTSIIDVDRLIAEVGGSEHVTSTLNYSDTAHDKMRDEFLRVLEDIGFFERRPLVMQVGRTEYVR